MSTLADRSERDAAVIDIGSNSIRLVIYRLDGRAIWTVFNEKVLAGLGREVAQTGRLSPDGIEAGLGALRRFKAVLDAAGSTPTSVVATAAVRDAADGPAFVARIKEATGLVVRVLTGEEEARFAAQGVLAGAPEAEGLVGDLGGSSLELTPITNGRPQRGVTLPLGPFALRGADGFDAARSRAHVARILERYDGPPPGATLHAVGGGWRNLALLQMRIAGYPLQIVHQYEISGAEALEAATFIARQSRSSLERIEGVSKRRLDTIPYAALVLEGLIERLKFDRISVSAYGVREGLLYEAMSPGLRAQDPLIAGAQALGARSGLGDDLGPALQAWLAPLFAGLTPLFGARDRILVAAACRLADLGARLHPDHRADLVFEQVLRAPLAGLNHAERAFLAVALFARHTASGWTPEANAIARVLAPERVARARALGAAMRLGCDLSGRNATLLGHSQITVDSDVVLLTADAGWADMLLGEQTAKRATTLADQLDLGLRLGR